MIRNPPIVFDLWIDRLTLCDDRELKGGADRDFVGVGNVVGFGDFGVFVGVGVEEQADGGESVAGFYGVGLGVPACIGDLMVEVGVGGVRFFDVVPNALEDDAGGNGTFDVKLLSI